MILAGRRVNDGMGGYVASQVVKLMTRRRIHVVGANVLILGLTFKENCPDLRNTRVVDLVREFQSYNAQVDVHDPWVNQEEALEEYGIAMVATPKPAAYDGIILAVAHDAFKAMSGAAIRSLGRAEHVLYDLKHVLSSKDVDIRL